MIIHINTVSGKIIAGSVTFNSLENNIFNLPLKRCSDKSASIAFSIEFSKVKKIRDIEGKT